MSFKVSRRFWIVVISAVVILIVFGNSGFRRLVRRVFEIRTLSSKLEYLKRENVLLKKEANLLENDQAYLERIARRELGFIAGGEYEYRFKKEEAGK